VIERRVHPHLPGVRGMAGAASCLDRAMGRLLGKGPRRYHGNAKRYQQSAHWLPLSLMTGFTRFRQWFESDEAPLRPLLGSVTRTARYPGVGSGQMEGALSLMIED